MEASFFENKHACCFTGHRPFGLPDERSSAMVALRLSLIHAVQDAARAGVTRFLCGGAEGFDTLAAEAVIAVRRDCPAISLTLALPSRRFLMGRSKYETMRGEAILDAANEVFYAGNTNATPFLLARNRYLVDHADCCVAYLKKAAGGTLYTVNYALERGVPVKNLAKGL